MTVTKHHFTFIGLVSIFNESFHAKHNEPYYFLFVGFLCMKTNDCIWILEYFIPKLLIFAMKQNIGYIRHRKAIFILSLWINILRLFKESVLYEKICIDAEKNIFKANATFCALVLYWVSEKPKNFFNTVFYIYSMCVLSFLYNCLVFSNKQVKLYFYQKKFLHILAFLIYYNFLLKKAT